MVVYYGDRNRTIELVFTARREHFSGILSTICYLDVLWPFRIITINAYCLQYTTCFTFIGQYGSFLTPPQPLSRFTALRMLGLRGPSRPGSGQPIFFLLIFQRISYENRLFHPTDVSNMFKIHNYCSKGANSDEFVRIAHPTM